VGIGWKKAGLACQADFLRRAVEIADSLAPRPLAAEKQGFYQLNAHRMLLLSSLSGIKQRSFLGARFLRL
jgi:hypothetical protein